MIFAVNCIVTNSIVVFAVNYSDGVYGKENGIVSIAVVIEAVHDVDSVAALMTKLAL